MRRARRRWKRRPLILVDTGGRRQTIIKKGLTRHPSFLALIARQIETSESLEFLLTLTAVCAKTRALSDHDVESLKGHTAEKRGLRLPAGQTDAILLMVLG